VRPSSRHPPQTDFSAKRGRRYSLFVRRPGAPLLAVAALLFTSSAAGNGRYPATNQLVVAPTDPSHLVVRSTYGLVVTRDAGKSWGWVCEDAIGFTGVEDPAIAVTSSGSILAALFEGLAVSTPDACGFGFDPSVGKRIAIDVSVAQEEADHGYAIVWPNVDAAVTELWATTDAGRSWSRVSKLPSGFTAVTIDAARSSPTRIYASGSTGTDGKLAVSNDGGGSWVLRSVPGTTLTTRPYLAAIDPTDADVVWIRLSGDADALLLSSDGGTSFESVFAGHGPLEAFALSPDGSELLVGGEAGLWHATTAALDFARVSALGPACLAWTEDALYACGDDRKNGFAVGRSTDGGKTFEPLFLASELGGPLACDPGAAVSKVCPALWPATQCTLGGRSCLPSTDAGAAGGGASTGSSSDRSACSCRVGSEGRQGSGATLMVVSALGWFGVRGIRRRRQRRLPPRRRSRPRPRGSD
jgi:photosystem II stability/assembly factor-like uncharacterized protein